MILSLTRQNHVDVEQVIMKLSFRAKPVVRDENNLCPGNRWNFHGHKAFDYL